MVRKCHYDEEHDVTENDSTEPVIEPAPELAERSAGHLLALSGEAMLTGGAATFGGLAAKDAYGKVSGAIKGITHKEPPKPPPSAADA